MEDYLIIIFRIVTIMALLLAATLFVMGKRPIGELPVFDFLVLVVMGSVVGADIADPNIEHLPTAFAVVVLAVVQRLFSFFHIKSRRFRKIITFEPTVVVYNGKLIRDNIKRIHYSADEILTMLREKDVFDISRVEYGVVEANGSLSVLRKPGHEAATLDDLKLPAPQTNTAVTVVLDGRLQPANLKALQLSEQALQGMLKGQGIERLEQVFFAAVDMNGNLNVSTCAETARDYFASGSRNNPADS